MQIRHNPLELIDFSVQPVMFLLLFTYVFGGAIGGSPKAYLLFALPGIIVQNSLFTTLNTATGLSTDLEKGFFDRLRSLPIARFAQLSGRILADLAKQTWTVAIASSAMLAAARAQKRIPARARILLLLGSVPPSPRTWPTGYRRAPQGPCCRCGPSPATSGAWRC